MKHAVWQPFVQFRLLMWMLGSTVLVALLLGVFVYVTFSDLIAAVALDAPGRDAHTRMIETQLAQLFRYCGVLFLLYVLLLAAVCIIYTHRLIGPLRPFSRHVDELARGNYRSRVRLRRHDLELFRDHADRLNRLAVNLDMQSRHR